MFELAHQGGLARLTLNRPQVRNAIPLDGWDQFAERVAEAASARLLIVEGAGGAFCAGADLTDFVRLREDEAERTRFRTSMRRALGALAALPIPTIARIDGACYGAGVAVAMACDLRQVGPNARFAITPAKIGISYPQEDVHRLVALVGPGQAARLLFTGAPIDAEEALRIGLADVTEDLSAAILANDATSLATLKQSIRLGTRSSEAQDRAFDALFASDTLAARLAERRR
jgi:enoyl-CoA hydratase/carnithine racemase